MRSCQDVQRLPLSRPAPGNSGGGTGAMFNWRTSPSLKSLTLCRGSQPLRSFGTGRPVQPVSSSAIVIVKDAARPPGSTQPPTTCSTEPGSTPARLTTSTWAAPRMSGAPSSDSHPFRLYHCRIQSAGRGSEQIAVP
jgi:hypothetical protein